MPSTPATGKGRSAPYTPWILITGASSGIGRASTLAFLEQGRHVVGLARSAERLASLADEIPNPDRFTAQVVDVTDGEAMARTCADLLQRFGAPATIIANAGLGMDGLFTATSDESWKTVFEVNVFGVVRSLRPFVAPMVDRGEGRILIVSSIVGKRGIPYYSAYSASKFALHGLAEALRAELVGSGVTVGLICPGSTATEFRDHALSEGPRQHRSRPRRLAAETVAQAIVKMADSARQEKILPWEAKLLSWANRLAPRLVDRILGRSLTNRDAS